MKRFGAERLVDCDEMDLFDSVGHRGERACLQELARSTRPAGQNQCSHRTGKEPDRADG